MKQGAWVLVVGLVAASSTAWAWNTDNCTACSLGGKCSAVSTGSQTTGSVCPTGMATAFNSCSGAGKGIGIYQRVNSPPTGSARWDFKYHRWNGSGWDASGTYSPTISPSGTAWIAAWHGDAAGNSKWTGCSNGCWWGEVLYTPPGGSSQKVAGGDVWFRVGSNPCSYTGRICSGSSQYKECLSVPGTGGVCSYEKTTACSSGYECQSGSCVKIDPCLTKDCSYLSGPCTQGYCSGGQCYSKNVSGSCNDGDPCTVNDTCSGGSCSGSPKSCPSDDCGTGYCQSGTCLKQPKSGPCNDGDGCTLNDYCVNGTCVGGGQKSCDYLTSTCALGMCSGGSCIAQPRNGPCSDGNPCTLNDTCSGGACQPGTPMDCSYLGGACTTGMCIGGACQTQMKSGPCEDGNPCTLGDTCQSGTCVSGLPKDCSGLDGPCSVGVCQGGACAAQSKSGTCNDGNPCTVGDVCNAGTCQGAPKDCAGVGDQCNTGVCVSGTCVKQPTSGPCNDGNACTENDTCSGGSCQGTLTKPCDDGNPCTTDSCANDACVFTPNAAPCDDGDPCTLQDVCSAGACTGKALNPCDDANPCTDDACTPFVGCTHTANTAPCEDGNLCTVGDTCAESKCLAGPPKVCDDAEACTDDACLPESGCAFTAASRPCDDGEGCTVGDTCVAGTCQPGAAMTCDDGNPCTDDLCAQGACQHLPNTNPCDDHNVCTAGDRCEGGACASGGPVECDDDDPCTADACKSGTGCTHTFEPGPCDDGDACTVEDYCADGACVSGLARVCDDNEECTADACVPTKGCIHENLAGPCDDGDACTANDVCQNGACQMGKPVICDDANPCTTDTCHVLQGCLHADNTLDCEDGNACTVGEHCMGGACVSGLAKSCDDVNPCTDDACIPSQGCIHEPNSQPCDDGNACTLGDQCNGAKCIGGAALACDDGDPCTVDTCEPAGGCAHGPVAACPGGLECGTFCGVDCGKCLAGAESCVDHACRAVCHSIKEQKCLSDGSVLAYCDLDSQTFQVEDCAKKDQVCALNGLTGALDCCAPACEGKACGKPDDLCQASCGECSSGEACVDFQCVPCTCSGKECGVDECGTACPPGCDLASGEHCVENRCVSQCEDIGLTADGWCKNDTTWIRCVDGVPAEKDCFEDGQRCNGHPEAGPLGCTSCEGDCEANGWTCGVNACGESCGSCDVGSHCSASGIGTCQQSGDCQCICDPPCLSAEPAAADDAPGAGGDTAGAGLPYASPDAGGVSTHPLPVQADSGCSTTRRTGGSSGPLGLLVGLLLLAGWAQRRRQA